MVQSKGIHACLINDFGYIARYYKLKWKDKMGYNMWYNRLGSRHFISEGFYGVHTPCL